MKIVLGLNCFHADSSACIVIDGKLVAAIEEERINRIKHWAGFPELSIKECIKIAKIKSEEITDIAINTNPYSNFLPKSFFFLKNFLFGKKKFEILNRYKNKFKIKEIINKKFNLNSKVKIHYINHHISHIASAFYISNFHNAVGLSIDGSGDFSSLMITECKKNKIKILKQIFFPQSLGIFYEAMTQFLGFKNYGDEYKVMGLAPYGKPIYVDRIFENIIKKNSFFSLNLNFFNHHNPNFKYIFNGKPHQKNIFSKKINKIFDKKLFNSFKFKADFAASIQKVYEDIFFQVLTQTKKLTGCNNIVLSGGCALNSSANRILLYNKLFKKIFIPYSPGDGGGSIGAALFVSAKKNKFIKKQQSPYLGSEYSDLEIQKIINKNLNRIKFKKYTNENELLNKTSDLLINKKVIGWFQGRMEFGPRALGNRSILANPSIKNMKEIINKKIKRRESFRPFAPAILKDYRKIWYKKSNFENLYMSSVEYVNEKYKNKIPAVTHIDTTGRLQVINKKINKKFFNLVKVFYKKTKIPILLNTSFNENEPIVRTPQEAIACLLRTNMDALIISNFIVSKK